MKIALAQLDIIWEDKRANRLKCEKLAQQASEASVNLLLFPEMTLTGFTMNVAMMGESKKGETTLWFQELAKKYKIALGFGVIEKTLESRKGKNNYIIVDEEGKLLSSYSKIHPFSFGEEALHYQGGTSLSLVNYKQWVLSSFICYDLRFPEIFQAASKKASIITIAANWPEVRIKHWEVLLKARAIENQCYIAAVNRTGSGNGIKYSGSSMIIDPLGNVLSQGASQEALISCEINIENVYNIRENFKLKKDRREDLYKNFYTTTELIDIET